MLRLGKAQTFIKVVVGVLVAKSLIYLLFLSGNFAYEVEYSICSSIGISCVDTYRFLGRQVLPVILACALLLILLPSLLLRLSEAALPFWLAIPPIILMIFDLYDFGLGTNHYPGVTYDYYSPVRISAPIIAATLWLVAIGCVPRRLVRDERMSINGGATAWLMVSAFLSLYLIAAVPIAAKVLPSSIGTGEFAKTRDDSNDTIEQKAATKARSDALRHALTVKNSRSDWLSKHYWVHILMLILLAVSLYFATRFDRKHRSAN